MVETSKRKQQDRNEWLRSALRLERVRADAEFGIGFGMQSATKGPVNIVSVEERTNSQFSAMFAHNPNLERSAMGGLAMLWVMIPKVDEPEGHQESSHDTIDRLRKLRRADEEVTADPSRN